MLLIFVYHSFGYFLLYFPVKNFVKNIVHEVISEEHLESKHFTKLVFNYEMFKSNQYTLKWEEYGKEFKFEGKMYDIKHFQKIDDQIVLTCYEDKEENLLNALFDLSLDYNKKDKKNLANNFNLTFGFYWEDLKFKTDGLPLNLQLLIKFADSSNKNHISDIPSPPPRIS